MSAPRLAAAAAEAFEHIQHAHEALCRARVEDVLHEPRFPNVLGHLAYAAARVEELASPKPEGGRRTDGKPA